MQATLPHPLHLGVPRVVGTQHEPRAHRQAHRQDNQKAQHPLRDDIRSVSDATTIVSEHGHSGDL